MSAREKMMEYMAILMEYMALLKIFMALLME